MVQFERSNVPHSNLRMMHKQTPVLIELKKSRANFMYISHASLMLVGSSKENDVPNLVICDKGPALQSFHQLSVKARK